VPKTGDIPDDILQFISRRIDSVPHLEALLLLWTNHSRAWTVEEVATRIYVSRERAAEILSELARHGLIVENDAAATYNYDSSWDEAQIMPRISATYQRHLVYVASLIHSKSSSEAVKQFAKAFQFTKKE
jgi:Mn-dependent DtxR family transcriptional regulator